MKVRAELVYEKDAPKSHAYGIRTEDGILIKVWVPKSLSKKPVEVILAEVEIPTGKSVKKSKGKKRKQDDDEDDEEEDDEEEDD
jgi:hypothetical protein